MHKYVLAAMVSLVALSAAASEKPTTPTNPTNTNQNHNGNTNLNGNANLNGNKNYNTNKNYNNSKSSAGAIAGAEAEQEQDQDQSSSLDGGDNKVEAYAISYTDAAPNTVAASIGDGVVVTTWGVKVLGPIFGMTDQHVHALPGNVTKVADLVYTASTNDGSVESKAKQHSAIVALCGDNEYVKYAELRFGEDACDNLNKLFNSLP